MPWIEELLVAEAFEGAGGGVIIADDPRVFPLTWGISPAPLRAGGERARFVRPMGGAAGWSETTALHSDNDVRAVAGGLLLVDASGELRDPGLVGALRPAMLRLPPGIDPPGGYVSFDAMAPAFFVNQASEDEQAAKDISRVISRYRDRCEMDPYDRMQKWVGENCLVTELSFHETRGPVAVLHLAACRRTLSPEGATDLFRDSGSEWPRQDEIMLSLPRFGDAAFRVRLTGVARGAAKPEISAAGECSAVPVSGEGWACLISHDPAPHQRCLEIRLRAPGIVVERIEMLLPPLPESTDEVDTYDALAVYAQDSWTGR